MCNILDPAFCRTGRFDVKIELDCCDHYQIQTIYNKFLNKTISTEILKKIPENVYTPADVIFRVKDFMFNKHISCEEILRPFIHNVSNIYCEDLGNEPNLAKKNM